MQDVLPKKILVVEDDDATRYLCQTLLTQEGFEVEVAANSEVAEHALAHQNFDLLLLDLNLPDADGIELAQWAVNLHPQINILMMTVRQEIGQRVLGFRSGAKDYMAKPFHPEELIYRVSHMIAMSNAGDHKPHNETVPLNRFQYSMERHSLFDEHGERIHLTEGENTILAYLVRSEARAVSRWTLLNLVKRGDREGHPRTVDILVSRLRKKIENDPSQPKLLITIKGLGYQLNLPKQSDFLKYR